MGEIVTGTVSELVPVQILELCYRPLDMIACLFDTVFFQLLC